MDDITGLLQQGDPRSFDRAVELVYEEMRTLARIQRHPTSRVPTR